MKVFALTMEEPRNSVALALVHSAAASVKSISVIKEIAKTEEFVCLR